MSVTLRGIDSLPAATRQKWAAARVWTAHHAPYLASAILALEPIVVHPPGAHDLRAFPTDPAWHIYLDPEVLAGTPVPEIGFWLLHQVTHLLREHAARYPGEHRLPTAAPTAHRTPQQRRWNLAADAEIDDDLRADGVPHPERAGAPADLELPDGWLAEQYWDALAGRAGAGRDAGRDGAPDPPDCGTGADGQPRPWNCGLPGLSETDRTLLGRDVARRIREHTRTRGDTPAGWQRWADEILDPVIDWRQALRSAVRRGLASVAGRIDFTYRRPSRRAAALPGIVLPSLHRPLPQVAVVIDTSGSMSDPMLAQVLGEIAGLCDSVGVARHRMHVLCCDAQAYAAQRIVDARDVRLLGGGGTDLRVGLAAAAGLRPRPDVIVVLTDGLTPWPADPPGRSRVIVGLLDPAGTVPEWARAVAIDPATLTGSRGVVGGR